MRKYFLKSVISVFLVSVLFVSTFSFIAKANEAVPFYNNVTSANSVVTISNSGVLTVVNKYSGSSSVTTKAIITTYVRVYIRRCIRKSKRKGNQLFIKCD